MIKSIVSQYRDKALALIVRLCGRAVGRLTQLYASLACRYRGLPPRPAGTYRKRHIDGVWLEEKTVVVNEYPHLITKAGAAVAPPSQTLIFMGGMPSDSSESLHWLVAELCKLDSRLRCIILHLPYMEEATKVKPTTSPVTYARFAGKSFPFKEQIDLSREAVDVRYDHQNQAIAAYNILSALDIRQAHFIGHDRGAVIFDYLIGDHPDIALSYARGAQIWDYYDAAWLDLAPALIVGPPHRFMVEPWQCRLLFYAVMHLAKPIYLLSPKFAHAVKHAKRGTQAYDRKTHLLYHVLRAPDNILLKIKHSFMQTDSTIEVANRAKLKKTAVPIMQFQGEDEFARDARGRIISDQPYFGKYNLYPNDVEDLYPHADTQNENIKRTELLENCESYKLLKCKPNARLNRFALIPCAAHFNIVENPMACAAAIYDFITLYQ